jgi:GNAT superfamily N-acetyltransferase
MDDVVCREGDLTIRRVRDDPADFRAMAAWRAAPHVHEWWNPDSREASEIGLVHAPDSFGVDVHIGVPDRIDRGIGSRAVALVCRHLAAEHGASEVLLMTELTNHRAQRAYEKAGFVKIRHILDTDTRGGERVWCWLMRWTPTA